MAITVKHSKVSTIPDDADTSLVRPSDWNADHTLVGTVPVANGGTGAATLTGYVVGNGTSAMTAATTIPNTDVTGLGTASTKDAGVANGVATLDSGGQVPLSQLPPLGDLNYQGTWNATTNSPTLTSSVGTKGYYYVVSVAGSTNLNGITDWKVSDWAVYNGTAWQKIDNTDAVTSVNGQTGAVNITLSGLGAGTIATQNASNVTITGGTLNAVAIGGSTAGDGTFDVLTANVTNLTNVTSSAGIVITGTFTGSSPTDGLVMDYSTGWGRFSDFGGDGFQWFNAGLATTKLMELSSTGALATTGTVTANGTLLTGNLGTVTSVTGTAPVVSSGGTTPAISMAAANTTTNGYLTSTDWNTFNGKSNTNGTVTSVAALTLGTTGTDLSSTVATGTTTPVITLQVPTASATNRGALSSSDWTTFNNKQPAGTYLTAVTSDAPLSGSGTSGSHLVIATANTTTTGAISSTDWNTFNGKQAALVSGTNIKTVAGVSLLGSGDVGLIGGTYGGTGVNNGSNTITIAGNLTHAGAFTQSYTATANTAVTLPAGATAASNNLLSSATAVGIVTGTPSSTTYLRGDGTWATPSATPAGSTTQVQYNNAGAFGASSSFTYASSTLTAPIVSASNGLVVNSATVSASYSIPSGSNAMSVGPVTVASGQSVTVPSGNRWVVL